MTHPTHLRRSAAVTSLLTLLIVVVPSCLRVAPAAAEDCGDVSVSCGASADPGAGYFHGVIGVTGQDWVLDLSSHAGNSPGCGDCVWTVQLDCPGSSPNQPDSSASCAGMTAGSAGCPRDALPFRLYLTTSSVSNEFVGRICLGGSYQIVLVGEDAEADVERYARDVTPPDLIIHRRPHGATLTGLATYFRASVPASGLGPVSFGGPTVTEAITLVPEEVDWAWGDGAASGWLPVDATAEHRYLTAGVNDGTLTTRWGATYTATFEGHTVGPFRAHGELDHPQPFIERVDTSSPVLVDDGPAG